MDKYIVVQAGKVDKTLEKKYRGKSVVFISNNAYVASCLQNGIIIGYEQGTTTVDVYEKQSLQNRIDSLNVIVTPSVNKRMPLFVNRWNGVPRGYRPDNLIEKPAGEQFYSISRKILICADAAEAYEAMARDAMQKDGICFKVNYAYRSYEEQEKIIEETDKVMGMEETMKTAAPAGFSEHHTGLALDVSGAIREDGTHITENEDAYKWLADNCYKYGFMIKNLKGKEHITGTAYEPWHIRYIGDLEITELLHAVKITLDEYLYEKCSKQAEYSYIPGNLNEAAYIGWAVQDSDRDPEEITESFVTAKEKYGIPFQQTYKLKLYNFSEKTISTQSEKYQKEQEDKEKYYNDIENATGLSREDIDLNLSILNENPYTGIDLPQYAQLKMYDMDDDSLKDILAAVRKRRMLSRQISAQFKKIDSHRGEYKNVLPLISEYYVATKKTLLESDIDEFRETIEKCAPEILDDRHKLENTVVDMLVCKRLMGFWPFEYFMFKLQNKSVEERRKYVSNIDRTLKLSKVNDRIQSEFLDNKFLTYQVLKEFYKRDMILVESISDYTVFENFISKHKRFVKKPVNGAMSSGIGLVQVSEQEDPHELLKRLLDDVGSFEAEEVIVAHEGIKKLNPDSVNTVRLSTLYDNGDVHILWPWMKVGRAGSFVDNSGAGGMGVAIDMKTGFLMSDGMDEHGNSYDKHPDTGLEFMGYKLPEWEKALDFGKSISAALAERIEGIHFVGWDITYTENNEWVVVEGNAFPQFVQQATYARGFKTELNQLIK